MRYWVVVSIITFPVALIVYSIIALLFSPFDLLFVFANALSLSASQLFAGVLIEYWLRKKMT